MPELFPVVILGGFVLSSRAGLEASVKRWCGIRPPTGQVSPSLALTA
jgi:hypothetical protein